MLYQGRTQPVAIDRGAVYHMVNEIGSEEVRISSLPHLRWDRTVRRTRREMSERSAGQLDVGCGLNVWPCDREIREMLVTEAMRQVFGASGQTVFEPIQKD